MAITNKDIEKMKEVFATKEDLAKLKDVFATKEDLERFETKADAAVRHNEVMKSLDALMKEKETAREDRTLAIGKDRDQDRRLEDHEKRITKLEVRV
jgi:hypothetical protein